MRHLQVEVGGRSMRCLVGGTGRPLLLCHGFLSSAEEFGGRFTALAEHRTLIIPDLPGNGESAPLASEHTVDALAQSLEELLDRLDVWDFDVAGLCLGASVAAALAQRCGDRVGRLVLHTPLIAPALIRRLYRDQIRLLTLPPLWRCVVALSRNRTVSNLYKRFVIVEGEVDRRTAEVNFANQRRADPAAAREWLRDAVCRRGLDQLLETGPPTLVIMAAHDKVVDVQLLAQLVEPQEHIRVFVDSAQGHGWNPAAVQRQLRVMLEFFDWDIAGAPLSIGTV